MFRPETKELQVRASCQLGWGGWEDEEEEEEGEGGIFLAPLKLKSSARRGPRTSLVSCCCDNRREEKRRDTERERARARDGGRGSLNGGGRREGGRGKNQLISWHGNGKDVIPADTL